MANSSLVVATRLTPEEKSSLDAFCAENNVTASSVMRNLISELAGKPLPLSQADKTQLAAVEVELRRIGINLNQAVRAMNEGRIEPSFLMADALSALLMMIKELRVDIDTLLKPKYQRLRKTHDGA